MIRVVVDTNVLVSGTFWSGPPALVLNAWRKRAFHWLVSPEILEEYQRALGKLASDFPTVPIEPVL
jgi:predicted nucleic acid-binding protein